MRIGIFFGGQSREREISYLGGRTAYENLDKSLFTAIPIFVDSFGNFILIKEEFLYKSGIRDFYSTPKKQAENYQLYAESYEWTSEELEELMAKIGQKINPQDFHLHFDFAFIALHGQPGEDGSLQGLFEWYNMPYSGCGILSSAIGIDKITQNQLMAQVTGQQKRMKVIGFSQWKNANKQQVFEQIVAEVGLPFVAKAPHQGSSIGVAIIKNTDIQEFTKAVNRCFFLLEITKKEWLAMNETQKHSFLQATADLDKGIAFPLFAEFTDSNNQSKQEFIYHPIALEKLLDTVFQSQKDDYCVQLFSKNCEDEVLFEEFIKGQEFSCGVIQDEDGIAIALPPTEIISASTFDFDSKYKAGGSRKVIPINTSNENIEKIQQAVATVFTALKFNVCARIDGFLTANDEVILHDPNTIPGMSPSSLIFKQTAEIGLNVTQTITYLIRASLQERIKTGKNTVNYRNLLNLLDQKLVESNLAKSQKEIEVLTFTNDETSFANVKTAYIKAASQGNIILKLQLISNNNENKEVHFALLMKDTLAEMYEIFSQPRHPMLVKNAEVAKKLVAKYF
jgi:D-alanine-D-alanine ligase